MRTLFEDTTENTNRQDDGATKGLPLIMWSVALFMIVAAVGAYFFVRYQQNKQAEQKPVEISVKDSAQVSKVINEFNQLVVAGKWDEAEKMISNDAKTLLAREKKTLRESVLERRFTAKKDDKLVTTVLTPSSSSTENSYRVDCAYLFEDKEQMVIAITVIKEGDKLVINSWN